MNAENRVIELLSTTKTWLSSSEINKKAKINNPAYTSRVLKKLFSAKKVLRRQEGRNVFYCQNLEKIFFEEHLDLKTTDENAIANLAKSELYRLNVPDHIDSIFTFAFTEMLNNAKDHSRSNLGYAKIWKEHETLKFLVRDNGIGVFRNIKNTRFLRDEYAAIQELVKGKVTTHPSIHSGEGIFWTSKMSDRFSLKSYNYALHVDTMLGDYTIEKIDPKDNLIGTEVYFEIALNSKKSISEIFDKFSLNHETYSFDTTEIPLKLYDGGDFWVSRSQAKRVLSGLDKYRKVIIDFKDIHLIGQGFADEIFRVFNIAHPNIILEPKNMNESVRMMVEKAINDPTGRDLC